MGRALYVEPSAADLVLWSDKARDRQASRLLQRALAKAHPGQLGRVAALASVLFAQRGQVSAARLDGRLPL